MAPATPTAHARQRCAQRNIRPHQIAYILHYGTPLHRTGVTFYILRRCDIPPAHRRLDAYAKLEGAVLLVASDGTLITTYRHRQAYQQIARKCRYRLSTRTTDQRRTER